MKIDYDFQQGTVRFEFGEPYNLESLRRYLLNYHGNLMRGYFVKCILVKGRRVFTYDFDGFFSTEITIPLMRQYKRYLESCFDDHIYPVSGIRTAPDYLADIIEAIRKQFVLEKHDFKQLRGQEAKLLPLICFVGIADMHGFALNDIMDEVDVEKDQFDNLLRQFREGIKEKSRVYTKTRLVLSYLRDRFEKYVDLGDLGD